ncbi:MULTISPECIES: plantaricin C family lantibiotic [Bacillus cereus group]|uniref:plantaricin C family lantibiotic n=1 Tax=Bacillus cereus group TaxID=86661 RepID=UPI0010BF1269|nr:MULTISPECIES: plantaricin C family lantibiotic [Bacillus cereus group]MBR9663726.1 plantaricin C family lantibiotic [Bacillus cereus]MBU4642491.1 plantaricin C family lantibiotic [Bacillus toyonensis]TKH68697.1 plantaricin C family lantibiotic [Bacillus cereus]
MIKSNLLKDPVLKKKLAINLDNPIGDIGEEIQEQDVNGHVGGLSPAIVSAAAGVLSLVSAATGGVIKAASSKAQNPGRYCTISAECFAGERCD